MLNNSNILTIKTEYKQREAKIWIQIGVFVEMLPKMLPLFLVEYYNK